MIYNTYIFNPVRADFIGRALETLYKYTDMENSRVIVVDQTKNGLFEDWDLWQKIKPQIHLYMHPYRNLGFSKSMNEGIIHGLRWNSQYITCANDDIEFMHSSWWDGVVETFKSDSKILAVNPMSPKEPGWGYGLEHGTYLEVLPYKKEFTDEDYEYLLKGDFKKAKESFQPLFDEAGRNNTYPETKNGMIDAIATWCTVFRGDAFSKIGLFEERFYPGSGEDYDLDARVYRENYRMVGTTKSWVWHHWGSSKDKVAEHDTQSLPIIESLRWADTSFLYPPEKNEGQMMDPWGKVNLPDGTKRPVYRTPEIGIVDF